MFGLLFGSKYVVTLPIVTQKYLPLLYIMLWKEFDKLSSRMAQPPADRALASADNAYVSPTPAIWDIKAVHHVESHPVFVRKRRSAYLDSDLLPLVSFITAALALASHYA